MANTASLQLLSNLSIIILGNGIGKSQSDGDIKNLDMKQNMKKLMLMTMNDEIRDDDEEE